MGKSLLLRAIALLDPIEVRPTRVSSPHCKRLPDRLAKHYSSHPISTHDGIQEHSTPATAAQVGFRCRLWRQGGALTLSGQTPKELGVPRWRSLVTYVPQTRVHPGGTPAAFYFQVQVHMFLVRDSCAKVSSELALLRPLS